MASDRVLPVHFGLLSLVLFIRGASFVCPALAFELRVLDLAFLVSRPPAPAQSIPILRARYVPSEGFRCEVVLQSFSATLFQVISLQEQGIKQTQTHPIEGEAIDRASTISPHLKDTNIAIDRNQPLNIIDCSLRPLFPSSLKSGQIWLEDLSSSSFFLPCFPSRSLLPPPLH